MSTPNGYAFALILFFGRGRGRGGRATAKPTVSRRTSADGFAVKMKLTKAGVRIVKSCSPFSAAKWQRQKSRQSRGKGGDFLRSKKYYSALTVWIVGTEIERGLFFIIGYGIISPRTSRKIGSCRMEKSTIMNLIEQINLLFGGFQDKACRAYDGYNPDWRPNWKDEVETELNLIKEHFPFPLPEDYCEIFRKFGGGCIEDKRPNWVIPEMSFWIWDDMEDFDATVGFFEDCPNGFPFGDDIGDVVYFYVNDRTDTGIYMAGKSVTFDKEFWHKIAGSFTELFTSTEAQRLFRNFYQYGCDKGTDGR